MPKLLQINECLNLSTGKIAQQIGEAAMKHGWESWIAYSSREPLVPCKSNIIKVGDKLNPYVHYANHRLFDREGLSSAHATKKLVKQIKEMKPDIIHLHNIHDHWLNIEIIFDYFAESKIPVVWTQHDCWSFTGGCMYYDMLGCDKWKNGCHDCNDKRSVFLRAEKNFEIRQRLYSKIDKIAFVPVSDWLGDSLKQSMVGDKQIITIHNGTNTNCFAPKYPKKNDGKYHILGVAAVWDARKGLDDFVKLRNSLPEDYEITLVGLTEQQLKHLPKGINGFTRTKNVEELVKLYCEADVFVNPTYSDNFPTTNIEALACGTPVITFKTGGSPEAIDDKTGLVIKQGDVISLANSIMELRANPLSSDDCRKRAVEYFDKNECFEKYVDLYNELIKK